MNNPVDLTNLRTMTDGDTDMEKALFEEFFSTFESGISVLKETTQEAAADDWRKQAHALKGVAMNLGAEVLGELCKQGQEECNAGAEVKAELLKKIQTEYERAKAFLETVHS